MSRLECDNALNAQLSSEDIVHRILNPCYEFGARFVVFSGGEFLLREDALDLLEEANRIGYRVRLASNGTTLNARVLGKLKELLRSNLVISLGINSFGEENKETRSVTGEYALETIELLRRFGIKTQVIVTIGKFNTETFSTTVDIIRRKRLPYNRSPFVPRNSARKDLMIDAETLKNNFHPTLRRYVHGYVSFTPFFLPSEIYEEVSGQSEKLDRVPTNPTIGCWCGSWIAINSEGEVAPCPLLLDRISGGNIRERGINRILTDSTLFERIIDRGSFEGDCGQCQYRFTCGGCRAMALYYTGNVFGTDPTCFLPNLSKAERSSIEKETVKAFLLYKRIASRGRMYTSPK